MRHTSYCPIVLHQIREDQRIARYTQRASTSHEPLIRPPVSSTPSRMQPIRGRWRGRERGGVDRRGRARDGGSGHGLDSDSGLGTLKPILPTSIPSYTYPSPEMFIPPHTCTSPSIPTHIDTSHSLPPHYTSPSILPHTYTSVPYPVSTEPASIAIDIPLSSQPLPSHTLPPMDDTILDLLPEWGRLPAGDLVLDVYIDHFIHQIPRLHQLPYLRLKLHRTLLASRLFILAAVLREI